ncbi:MAG: cation diffusion facilitator family transporter [Candidatus Hodarchaeales archaeon]|jgi:cation diffusion facilitator family transporter
MTDLDVSNSFGKKIWGLDEKTHAALTSVIAAIILTLTKLIVGIWSGSLGILSEALHSSLDLVAAGITLFAVKSSAKPADEHHQYGHGKIESLSAFIETILLLITVIWIVYEAARRILLSELEIHIDLIVFGVVILSIIIDYSRSRVLYRTAKKYDSEALKADALHFSTDILSSSVVFVGLIFASIGFPIGDPLAAIGVAIIVLVMTLRLGRETIGSLLDRAPLGAKEKVQTAALSVEGVLSCNKIRIRKSGPLNYIDIAIVLDPNLSLENAHTIGEEVKFQIENVISPVDVTIHMDPTSDELSLLTQKIRHQQKDFGFIIRIKNIYAFVFRKKVSVGLDLEVDGGKTLQQIQTDIEGFKNSIFDIDNNIEDIDIHIEPFIDRNDTFLDEEELKEVIKSITGESKNLHNPHGIKIFKIPSGFYISFHCKADSKISVDTAHEETALLERNLMSKIKTISRIYIYVESF